MFFSSQNKLIMKKITILVSLFLLLASSTFAKEVNVTFNVDLNFSSYVEGNKVWIVFGFDDDEYYIGSQKMLDPDNDRIFTYTGTIDIGDATSFTQEYGFVYSPSQPENRDAWVELELKPSCSNSDDFRELVLTSNVTDTVLPPFIFDNCDYIEGDRSNVTFQLDIQGVDDFEGQYCSLEFNKYNGWVFIKDNITESVYRVTLSLPVGETFKYYYSYQNGPDEYLDWNSETVVGDCAIGGERSITVSAEDVVLPAVKFGTCDAGEAGIIKRKAIEDLNVSPNPTSGSSEINFATTQSGTVSLYSINGQLMQSQNFENSNKLELDVTRFESGMYLLFVDTPTKNYRSKLIVE